MSIHRGLNMRNLEKQVHDNETESQFEWEPHKLKDNIFELIGTLKHTKHVQLIGNPVKVSDKPLKFIWKYKQG